MFVFCILTMIGVVISIKTNILFLIQDTDIVHGIVSTEIVSR